MLPTPTRPPTTTSNHNRSPHRNPRPPHIQAKAGPSRISTSTPSLSRPSSSSGHSRSRNDRSTRPDPSSLPLSLDPDPDLESDRQTYTSMAEPASPTPTPRHSARRRGRLARTRGGQQREAGTGEESEEGTAGEDELFGLLGMSGSAPPRASEGEEKGKSEENGRKGVLAVSKADIEASGSKSRTRERKSVSRPNGAGSDQTRTGAEGGTSGGPEARVEGNGGTPQNRRAPKPRTGRQAVLPGTASADSTAQSESDTPHTASQSTTPKPRQARTGRNSTKPTPGPEAQSRALSGLSAQLAAHPSSGFDSSSKPSVSTIPSFSLHASSSSGTSTAYDLTSLSRSLPSDALFAPSSGSTVRGGTPVMVERGGFGGGGMTIPHKAAKARRKKGVDSEDESKVWDEPTDAGPAVAQDMTWQQQLGSYPYADSASASASGSASGASRRDIPPATGTTSDSEPIPAGTSTGKSKRSRAARPVPSPLNPSHPPSARPTHSRRSSADALPTAPHSRHLSFPLQTSRPPKSANAHTHAHAPPPSAYQPSTFDTLPPFNPAQNVRRAPQTPAKGGLAHKYAVMELPLLAGGFPRMRSEPGLASQSGAGGGGMGSGNGSGSANGLSGLAGNYAGADFHNSPHGRALPKPDLEDF